MPRAFHHGGPADGATVPIDDVAAFGYHARAEERVSTGWVSLARYVFMPPRIWSLCLLTDRGMQQRQPGCRTNSPHDTSTAAPLHP